MRNERLKYDGYIMDFVDEVLRMAKVLEKQKKKAEEEDDDET